MSNKDLINNLHTGHIATYACQLVEHHPWAVRHQSSLRLYPESCVQDIISHTYALSILYKCTMITTDEGNIAGLNTRADLLSSYSATWQPGETAVTCQDFETGEPVSTQLYHTKLSYMSYYSVLCALFLHGCYELMMECTVSLCISYGGHVCALWT